MARPLKCRRICSKPKVNGFVPEGIDQAETVTIGYDEYEVIRLLDYAAYSQEQCAVKMNISRPTVTRMYENARKKVADALVNGKRIVITGGDVIVCAGLKPECSNERHCCHNKRDGS